MIPDTDDEVVGNTKRTPTLSFSSHKKLKKVSLYLIHSNSYEKRTIVVGLPPTHLSFALLYTCSQLTESGFRIERD